MRRQPKWSFLREAGVGTYRLYVDAETDRMALEAHGLRAWIFHHYGHPMEGIGPTVQLKVLAEDLPAAMRLLESETLTSSELRQKSPGRRARNAAPGRLPRRLKSWSL
jgi:hypothetical protein